MYISCVISEEGKVINVKVVRGVEASLDSSAVQLIRFLPDFKPGMFKGVPCKVSYTVPVTFSLSKNNDESIKE